ncbi:hypothetical protein BC938DRAFT_475567 [Jimgerdemannia flammicorona]|uniref:Uncharacterized protein n=1 Tax=Jimgerdemannia flammicorona TaxID=994334 RepID=A0A433PSA3_9FUNG|nr:hypothetical protein BC938DRAFT_475567 [Jimgerdemannia flammicorona]
MSSANEKHEKTEVTFTDLELVESSTQDQKSQFVVDERLKARVVRKIDLALLPILWARAKPRPLSKRISMFELPSNIVLRRWKPSLWIAIIMIGWGRLLSCYA